MKVLSVDDSATIRRIIRGAARVLGYEFLEASNGEEALSVLRAHPGEIGLVTLDINMPIMTGLELLKKLKEDADLRSIPVMMVTSQADRSSIVEAIKNGAKNYIAKPFTPEEITTKMLEVTGQGMF